MDEDSQAKPLKGGWAAVSSQPPAPDQLLGGQEEAVVPLAAASGHSQECPGGRLCWKLLLVPAELAAQLLFSVTAPL